MLVLDKKLKVKFKNGIINGVKHMNYRDGFLSIEDFYEENSDSNRFRGEITMFIKDDSQALRLFNLRTFLLMFDF